MKLPNFFLVGAAKGGTTSLHHYLSQHPDIYLPANKENFFFSGLKKNSFTGPGSDYGQVIVENFEEYLTLFKNVKTEKAVGEVCVAYLYYYEKSIVNFSKYLTQSPKIIIILRDPIERASSNYRHHVRDEIEKLSFEKAIKPKILRQRIEEKWWWGFQYLDVGFYFEQVNAYLNSYGREYVRIYLYEDLVEHPSNVVKDIYNFLNVDENFTPNTEVKYNMSPIIQSESFQEFLIEYNHPIKRILRPILLNTIGKRYTETFVNYYKRKNTMGVKTRTRRQLIELYRGDILRLESLINRDLSNWLK